MKYIKLFESFNSQKELEKLSEKILYKILETSLELAKNNIVEELCNCYLSEIDNLEFIELKDFLITFGDLFIVMADEEEFKDAGGGISNACYIKDISDIKIGDYNRYIFLKDNTSFVQSINDSIVRWGFEDGGIECFDDMKSIYKSILLHELVHAYDDFRSKGKYRNIDKDDNKNNDILRKKTVDNMTEQEKDLLQSFFIKYLNMKHEVDARFAQTIAKIKFVEIDWTKSNVSNNFVYVLLPFDKIVNKFIGGMEKYHLLTVEEKQRCLRKLGQFYEMEKELYKNNNKNK